MTSKRIAHAHLVKIKSDNGNIDKVIKDTQRSFLEKQKISYGTNNDEVLNEMYEYKWEQYFSKFYIEVPNSEPMPCYKAMAKIEFPRRVKFGRDGQPLDRKDRINVNHPYIILFRKNEDIYMGIITSYSPDINRVEKLFGEERVEQLGASQYLTDSFFVWIYYHYSKGIKIMDDLTLNNITGFTGIVSDPSNTFSGDSDNTANLIITKAFVSNKNPLKSLKLDVNSNYLLTLLILTEKRDISIDIHKTTVLLQTNSESEELLAISYVYVYLLPRLLLCYKKEENFKRENNDFSREIGIDVINSIVQRNNISLKEVSKLYKE
ncbi:hypothetical protein G8J22_00574 [Lentilactobacillus hilgardii]|uniref:hypothetical protein n=1 Tax=Lentilactobacillus hilgardii TaxID=1588 RepID=UPI00019C4768|nr:hypothetical protein [Lentilactobacillus hilgardii]EEI20377.1 hypothetical protein HMPREF0497_0867 [Lentilactobacillus buchneri ATCC 11577]MCT3396901.1 hypothetical protein [Lentilactobacillus hilgardii]QIR08640.1 hypothetical protein G8J22_00574 [Lentilactobacillus hilgardii]